MVLILLKAIKSVLSTIQCSPSLSDSLSVFHFFFVQATHGDYVSDAIALADLKSLEVVPVRTLQEHPTLSFW